MNRLLLLCLALPAPGQEIRLTQVATGISNPTDIQSAGDGSGRLFLVQQNGIIRIYRNGTVISQPFLDIRSKVKSGGEQGLLGLAFPPNFAQKQRFYVHYSDSNGDTTISQYRMSGNADQADPSSEIVLLHVTQPYANHKGGQIRFGPDGYLYIGLGDGGSEGDPLNNGQTLGTPLGKVLRVDVESSPGQLLIPPGNPFVQRAGARPEIWAYGLRNPWRFSFDSATGNLWIGDVGQDSYEEINLQPASSRGGENYGWSVMEGMHCYKPASGCDMQGLTLPVAEYNHSQGCAIIGGLMYRGPASPSLQGTYVYGDLCSGTIWGLSQQGSQWANRVLASSGFNITTFGVDEAGEIYVANTAGSVWRLVGSSAPQFSATSVVNAASFVPGLTPGSLATVFVNGVLDTAGTVSAPGIPLPTALNGVSITVNGVPAPIVALANRNGQQQANFQAPAQIAGLPSVSMVISRGGTPSPSVTVPVFDVQPGVFTSDGTNAIAVHNADFTLVDSSRPLIRGEYAFFYATGLGAVTNQPADGAAAPVSPLAMARGNVQVTIGGTPCEVQYAGLAPNFVGVYQVNIRVPDSAASGAQDLVVRAGAASSPAVKVTVR